MLIITHFDYDRFNFDARRAISGSFCVRNGAHFMLILYYTRLPAFYIRKTFKDLGTDYKMAEYAPAKVEIKVTKQGEIGKILKSGIIKLPTKITEPDILISTIGPNDLNLHFLSKYNGDVFLDIQGFIRDEKTNKLGAKKVWKNANTIINHITVLKGTTEELCFLSHSTLEKAKNKTLIETRGNKGVTLWEKGKKTNLFPFKKIVAKDTIGAGDTFMAAFVSKFVSTKDGKKATRFALRYTNEFLKKKENRK